MLSRKVWRAALRPVDVSPTLINAVRNQQVTPFLPTVGAFTTTTTLTSPVSFAVELLNTSTTLAAPVLDRWGYENYTHCLNALHSYNLQFADGFRTEESGNTVAGGAGEEGRGLVSVPLCGRVRSDPLPLQSSQPLRRLRQGGISVQGTSVLSVSPLRCLLNKASRDLASGCDLLQ